MNWLLLVFIILFTIIFIVILIFLVIYLCRRNSKSSKVSKIQSKIQNRQNQKTKEKQEIEQIEQNEEVKKIPEKKENHICNIQRDCPSGYICSHGKCKKGLGEVCIPDDKNDSGDCHSSYICQNVCRKRNPHEKKKNIRNIRMTEKGKIENRSIEDRSTDNSGNRYYERYNSPRQSSRIHSNSDTETPEYPVDICNFSTYIIYLLNTGVVILEENNDNEIKESRRIQSNIHIRNICNFNGYLNGISVENSLYYLDNDSLETDQWKWKKLLPLQKVIDFSVTHDMQYIWIRTEKEGILYNHDFQPIERVQNPDRRIYGVDKTNYIVINKKGITSYPNLKFHGSSEGILDILVDHKGVIHTLTKKKYRMIKMINYEIFYIS